jgi:hypothetical protein
MYVPGMVPRKKGERRAAFPDAPNKLKQVVFVHIMDHQPRSVPIKNAPTL